MNTPIAFYAKLKKGMSENKNTIQNLFVLGVQAEFSFFEKRDIIFTNQAVFVLMLSSFCILVANLVAGFYLRALVPLTCLLALNFCYYFQAKFEYQIAKSLAIFFPLISSIASTMGFGWEANTHLYIPGTLVLSLVVFHSARNHFHLFLIHLFLFVSLLIYMENFTPIFSGQDSRYLGIFHVVLILVLMYITLSQFARHYEGFELRITKLIVDINEKKTQLEAKNTEINDQASKLKIANENLEVQIQEKEEAKLQALESNQELERFAYVASHDLKEPLRTIGSFTSLVKRKCSDNMDEDVEKYFYYITDGVKRMSVMLDDLLALSKLNGKIEISEVPLQKMVGDIEVSLQQLLERCQGKIHYNDLPTVSGNKTQLHQLLQNLIANGIKFKKPDVPSRIKIYAQERRYDYVIGVEDNGIGIPKEHQKKVFTLFQRLHKKEEYEGTGIGLTVCKKIVENHGGTIWMESEEGVGTTMFFTIKKKEISHKEVTISESDKVAFRQNAVTLKQ